MQADGDGGMRAGECCVRVSRLCLWFDQLGLIDESRQSDLEVGGWFFLKLRVVFSREGSHAGPMFCGGSRYNFGVKD